MDDAALRFRGTEADHATGAALVCSALIFLEEKGVFRFAKIAPYGNQLQR